MASKKKKIGAAGKFSSGAGRNVRSKFNTVERSQRQTQPCPLHQNCTAKRVAAGIWECKKTGIRFAGHAYFLKEAK